MTPLVIRLGRHRWLHSLVAVLRIYPMADLLLGAFPLQRHLPNGFVYRVTSMDQLSIEAGIFGLDEYAAALAGRPIKTFIDLGCNAGWFALWLAASDPNPDCAGLLIDAHPRLAAEAAWHMQRNHLTNVVVVHGAVGASPDQDSITFHLHQSASASSALPFQPTKQNPAKGRIIDVAVPTVSVSGEWDKHFSGTFVDLLKVDIEGKELDFMVFESVFLKRRVKRIIVEWHEWSVSLAQLDAQLGTLGFERRWKHDERDMLGLGLYENLKFSD